jgi:hypothetical protein
MKHKQNYGWVPKIENTLEIVDVFEEIGDKKTLRDVADGRRPIRKGAKGILVSRTLKKN